MKFRSPSDQPVILGLVSGHMATVTPEGTELEPRFRRKAIAEGCIPMGIGDVDVPVRTEPVFDRTSAIREALIKMIEDGREEDFNSHGRPNPIRVRELIGINVESAEVHAVFDKMTAEAEAAREAQLAAAMGQVPPEHLAKAKGAAAALAGDGPVGDAATGQQNTGKKRGGGGAAAGEASEKA